MGLIIYKPQSANSNLYRRIAIEAAIRMKNTIYASVVIKYGRKIFFYQGLATNDVFNGLTGLYSVSDNDVAYFSLVDNTKNYNRTYKAEYSTLLTFDTHFTKGTEFNREGPYFILLGTYPYIIHYETENEFPKDRVVRYLKNHLNTANHFHLLNSARYEEIAEIAPNLASIDNVIIGDEEEQWIKNEDQYYSIRDIKVSDKRMGKIIEKGVFHTVAVKSKIEARLITRPFFYYRARVFYHIERFRFIPIETPGFFGKKRAKDVFIAYDLDESSTKVKIRSLITNEVKEIYFYELYSQYHTYERRGLYGKKSNAI